MLGVTAELDRLHRKPERGGDRALLDEVLDTVMVGTLSTVVDGLPWSVPMLFARHDDRIILHGSTGAGALRHVADGAPVTLTAFALDGIVVADVLFDHSANYRSAVVRGTLQTVRDDAASALDALSDKLIPGRVAEVRGHTRKEVAATATLVLPIVDGQWIAKARSGPPGEPEDPTTWTGVVPVRTVYDEPVTATGDAPPGSVRRLVEN
ncbi:pyridoxamine 5'-phosphate oxidase family protein [uncultured Williamsia sp.]|uniref:pyridoxamine 5'-phosphate oxidase family protein n=1 Tax=uncultured Williamsia sp. TaxID=259311 RepID=UPI00261F447F|nr:pyridoxamine 5'-phosphate oxidase family protein [uncultured Williamsia sp.]